ncbi:DUF2570 family protein [Pasteurellaceae bacterium 22721_9_1]
MGTFNFRSAVKIGALFLILGLCGWIWYQSQKITSLTAENQTQAQTIEQMNKVNEQLNNQLIVEQRAVEQQYKLVNQLKSQAERSREQVKVILQKDPCGVTAMPSPVIDSIKRLHHKSKD